MMKNRFATFDKVCQEHFTPHFRLQRKLAEDVIYTAIITHFYRASVTIVRKVRNIFIVCSETGYLTLAIEIHILHSLPLV
jgi:hypothetical protein